MNNIEKLLLQVTKFGVVGGIAFIIDYSILYFLTESFELYYMTSAAVAFSISTVFNYLFSMYWVFKAKQRLDKQIQIMIFIALSLIGLFINQIVMFICVEKAKIYYLTAKIIATIIVMIWNFITKKLCLEEHS